MSEIRTRVECPKIDAECALALANRSGRLVVRWRREYNYTHPDITSTASSKHPSNPVSSQSTTAQLVINTFYGEPDS